MKTVGVDKIIKQALKRPETERARIAEKLIASLDGTPSAEIEQAWQKEITRRVHEVDSGKVKCVPWEEIRDRLYGNAKARR